MAKRRRPAAEESVVDEGVPPELLDVHDPAWSSFESARSWFTERGWPLRGHLQPWFEARHFHRQAVTLWALEQGWRTEQSGIDWERLAAAGIVPVAVTPEELVWPPGAVRVE